MYSKASSCSGPHWKLRSFLVSCWVVHRDFTDLGWMNSGIWLSRMFMKWATTQVLAKESFDAHTDPIFKNLKILKFNCIYLFQFGKLMFQFKNGLLPRTFDSEFALNSQVHNNDTRSSKLFHILKIRTNICKFSLRYQGPRRKAFTSFSIKSYVKRSDIEYFRVPDLKIW